MTNTANGHVAREQRQNDAHARQHDREGRSVEEQISRLDSRPGASQRERDRLTGAQPTGKTKTSRQKRAKQKARA